MTHTEIQDTYTQLRTILLDLGLGWIIEQVEEQIRTGRSIEKEVRVFRDEEEEPAQVFRDSEAEARNLQIPFKPVRITTGSSEGEVTPRRPGKSTLMMAVEHWPDVDQLLFLIDGLRHGIVHAAAIEQEAVILLREQASVQAMRFETDTEELQSRAIQLSGEKDEGASRLGHLLDSLQAAITK